MKTIEAAHGRWQEIFDHYPDGRCNLKIIPNKHQLCPLCDRNGTNALRLHDKTGGGDYICVCSNGNGINLIMEITGDSFSTVAANIDKITGRTYDNQELKPIAKKKPNETVKLIAETSKSISGTLTELYLKERNIKTMPCMSVTHCDSLPFYNDDGKHCGNYPAMIATTTDALDMDALQYHITYLSGPHKIGRKVRNLDDVDYKMPVIRLMQTGPELGLAEGIETALSAHDLYGVPCWSTVNSGMMKRFRAPLGVVKLVIYADNDNSATGHAAAFECATRNLNSKNDVREVVVIWPNEKIDFNDLQDKEDINKVEFYK